jgi:hypothetical protein
MLRQNSILNKALEEINKFAVIIQTFDCSALRSVPVVRKNDENQFHRASKEAIEKLFDVFSDANFKNVDQLFKTAITENIESVQLLEDAILKLANALLNFKQHVKAVEEHYFSNKDAETSGFMAKMRDNSTWVVCFHYTIEQYLDCSDLNTISKIHYRQFVKKVKDLCEKTYKWLEKNKADELSAYATFQPEQMNSNKRRFALIKNDDKKQINHPEKPVKRVLFGTTE